MHYVNFESGERNKRRASSTQKTDENGERPAYVGFFYRERSAAPARIKMLELRIVAGAAHRAQESRSPAPRGARAATAAELRSCSAAAAGQAYSCTAGARQAQALRTAQAASVFKP